MIDHRPPVEHRMEIKRPTLSDALDDDKAKVRKVFQKYGKDDPYKPRPVPAMQWEGDNES